MGHRTKHVRNRFITFLETNVTAKLIILAIIFFIFWQAPDSTDLFSMFTLLATYYHEMSHGLAARAVGMEFSHVKINSDGNGYAQIYYHETKNKLHDNMKNSFVSFAGPLGGPLIGTALLMLSAHRHIILKRTLSMFGLMILFSTAIWVRGKDLGYLFLYLLGAFLLYASVRFPAWGQRAILRFLGIHACMAVFTEMDYLFSRTVRQFEDKVNDISLDEKMIRKFLKVKKKTEYTDTGEIQKMLGVPYESVAFAVITVSLLLMGIALVYIHYREKKRTQADLLPQ
jgi:hypothetical protein